MRKGRFVIEASDEVFEALASDPLVAFEALITMDIHIPDWAILLMVSLRDKLDVAFFDDHESFFFWYSKSLIRRGARDFKVQCLHKKEDVWSVFIPPTLVGTNLRSVFRF